MKVILNTVTNYQDRVLNIGDTADVELRVADRWITRGLAHLPAQSGVISNPDLFPLHNDGDVILNSKQQEALKKFIEEKKTL